MNGGTLEGGSSNSPGLLTIGSLSFSSSGGTLAALLNSPSNYSQVFVTGNTNLSGASLSVTLGSGFSAADTDQFNVIYGYDFFFFSFTGTFNGDPDGTVITVGTQSFRIHYNADHSVTLTPYTP